MTTIKQAMAEADEINCALIDAKNALDAIYVDEPKTPVERVQEGDRRQKLIEEIMVKLGVDLARTRNGFRVAHGLIAAVRVIRGERAETTYGPEYLRTKTAYVNGQPDHVEIECNEVERKKDYGK